ncbi:hypothetical protein D4R71_06140 [bacterium]|nr:MAG: hypothetical protein D4R71_06140 [bacterium]
MAALSISRRIKNFIMIGIIIISFIIAFEKSEIVDKFLKPSDSMGQTPKEAEILFQSSKYNSKLELQYISSEKKKVTSEIASIISEYDLEKNYFKSDDNNSTWLIEIPRDKYKQIIDKLRNYDELTMEELVQIDDQLLTESVEERIKDNEKRKEILDEGFKNARTAYDQENYNQNIIKIERIIDSLETVLRDQEKFSKNIYAKIDISHFVSRADATERAFKSFLTTFVISLLFISAALFLIYFIIILFTKLFSVLGIKTSHGRGSRNGSGYNYGSGSSYGYGYYDYGKRKKIKRKYIRKPRSEESESSEEHKDKEEK